MTHRPEGDGGGATAGLVVAVSVLIVASLAAGCDGSRMSGAPPLKICGQVLNNTPAGAGTYDASLGPVTVSGLTSGAGIYLVLAQGCKRGADIKIPAGAATIASRAVAKDGRLAAAGIHPLRTHFAISVTNSAGRTYAVTVSLSGLSG